MVDGWHVSVGTPASLSIAHPSIQDRRFIVLASVGGRRQAAGLLPSRALS